MNPSSSNRRPDLWSRVPKAAVVTVGFTAVALAAFQVQATPPANSVIGNQASASYIDNAGTPRQASSNLVQTVVQQVGAFQLTSNVTKTGAAGATVYMPHTLTNTGNGADTFTITAPAASTDFTRVEVFADANGDGLPDSTTPLCSSSGSPVACTTGFTQSVAGNSTNYTFVVAYTISPTASGWSAAGKTGAVTATAGTPALYTTTTASNTDTVLLTTGAAFSATKSLSQPAVAAPGGGAWPAAISSGQASSSGACATTWSASLASAPAAGCTYTVYTLRYTNTGAASGNFTITDQLPSGLTYVAGSAVWSSAGGTALGDGAGSDPAGISYDYNVTTANTLTATVANVGPNVSGTISFVVLVNSTATPTSGNTTNTANYYPTDCNPSVTACTGPTNPTNPSPFTVAQTYGVVTANAVSTTRDASTPPAQSGIDLVVQPTVPAGGSVGFTNVVTNTGNGTDTFNLATSCSGATTPACTAFPAGTTFTFYKADGLTPLLDTNADGTVDTGPVAAGASFTVVVKANVPALASAVGSGVHNVLVTATSVGDLTHAAASTDSVWNQVSNIIGSLVDLTNSAAGTSASLTGDLGPGPSVQPTTTNSTPAGTGTTFSLFVKNNDSINNVYSLAASQSPSFPGNLPTGWTVKFVASGGTCASAAITSIAVNAGAQQDVVACVTPPANATIATQNVYFQVVSTVTASTGGLVTDTKLDAVTVTVPNVAAVTLAPSNTGQVAPGGSVVYPHTLSNVGNQSCGAFNVVASLSAADQSAGWTTALYIDVNGNGQVDAGDTLVTTGSVPALTGGQQTRLLVKVFAPGGVTAGSANTVTVTATDSTAVCAPVTVTDTSTVVTGQVRVTKTQAADLLCNGSAGAFGTTQLTLKPGECIVYQIVATNEGAAPVSNVSIADAIPVYTTYAGATQPAAQCGSTGLTGTAVAYATTGAPVSATSCGSAANTLAPGGSVTLTFSVKVNP